MSLRILTILLLTIGLTFSVIGMSYAGHDNGYGNGGNNNGKGNGNGGDPAAPELDPVALASGIAILGGGVILLNERRRNRK
jgi:hypothetical protein